jgi:hypothetical protein
MNDKIMSKRQQRIEDRKKNYKPFGKGFLSAATIEYDVKIIMYPYADEKIEKIKEEIPPPPRPLLINSRPPQSPPPQSQNATARRSLLMPQTEIESEPTPVKEKSNYFYVRISNIHGVDHRSEIFILIKKYIKEESYFCFVPESCAFAFVAFFREKDAMEFSKRFHRFPFNNMICDASILSRN